MAAENPRVEFAMGVREEISSRGESAEAYFEKARSLDPAALPVVERVAGYRLMKGDRAGAVGMMKALAEAAPERVDVQLAYVDFLERTGRGDGMAQKLAVEVLEKVAARRPEDVAAGRPEDVAAISRLLTIFRERGDREKAEEWMEKLPGESAEAAEVYASVARSLFPMDDLEVRERVDLRYRRALEVNPEQPGLARAASEYFRETGRLDEAIGILEDHVKAAPWSLDLRTRLGVLLFSAKRDDEGVRVLKEVVEIRPGSGLALQSLAKFYRLKGEEKEARFYGAELLKARGGSAREFEVLADELLAADEVRAARILLEKGVFEHPGRVELAMKLAVATRLDPETRGKAGRLFREAEAAMVQGAGMDAVFLMESAEVLAEEGNGKAAEERLRTAIRSFPPERKGETAAALRKLASLWEREGRNEEAAKALLRRAEALER